MSLYNLVYSNVNVSNTVVTIKPTPGKIAGFHIYNANTTATLFVQLFNANAAGGVTLGTTTPFIVFPIPAANPYGATYPNENHIQFSNGITIAVTTTPTGATGGAGANLLATIFYK